MFKQFFQTLNQLIFAIQDNTEIRKKQYELEEKIYQQQYEIHTLTEVMELQKQSRRRHKQ